MISKGLLAQPQPRSEAPRLPEMSLPSTRILLIEDLPGHAPLLRELLSGSGDASYELVQVDQLEDGLTRLAQGGIDIVLVDISRPDANPLDAVRLIREHAPDVPVVVLAARDDEAQAVQAVQQGAQDYLVKGAVERQVLLRAIRYAIERHRMLTELEQARRLEHYLATHDILTHLPNRQLFQDRLHHALADARRHRRQVGVMFLDLDRFKLANDTLGHSAGDRLLRAVARRILGCIRESDTAARLGGDEFTVIVTGITQGEDVARVARKILGALSRPFVVDGSELYMTSSIGISLYPTDGPDVESLVRNADIAMYRAKSNGRNNFQFYMPAMNHLALERIELETNLRLALEREEFVVYYQPQVDARSGRVTGLEALVRWNHPHLGLLSPDRFIPLAEETGVIVPLGHWVLQTACAQSAAWQRQGLPPTGMAVNFSARQFQTDGLLDGIRGVLRETGLGPERLHLELTESAMMQDPDHALATLTTLAADGLRLSLDDFGKGYSSLSQLKRMPLHTLKIDEVFVRSITSDPQDRAIAGAIVSLARNLHLQPIAEGVETPEQLAVLQTLDCHTFQGYLYSRPLTAEAAGELLAAHA